MKCKLSDGTEAEENVIIGINSDYYRWSFMSRIEEYAIESQYDRVEVVKIIGNTEELPRMIYSKEPNRIVVEWIWK